jgi:hypothetical protein
MGLLPRPRGNPRMSSSRGPALRREDRKARVRRYTIGAAVPDHALGNVGTPSLILPVSVFMPIINLHSQMVNSQSALSPNIMIITELDKAWCRLRCTDPPG